MPELMPDPRGGTGNQTHSSHWKYGKYTAVASGFFMVMVCGGGIVPLIQGAVADATNYLSSYWVLFAATAYLLYYALIGSKVKRRDASAEVIAEEVKEGVMED